MFVLGNATFAYGIRSAPESSFEEASGETEVERRSLPLAPEPRPLPPLTLAPRTPPGTQTETQIEPATSAGVILPGHFLLLCSLQLWYNCNVVVKLVQECKFFLTILLPFYGNSLPGTSCFLGK